MAGKLGLLALLFNWLAVVSSAFAQTVEPPQIQIGAAPGVEDAPASPTPAPLPEPEPTQAPVPSLSPEEAATALQATFVTDSQLSADADRLEAAFAKLARHNAIDATTFVSALLVGGGLIAGGIYVATDDAEIAEDEGLVLLSGVMMVSGGGLLTHAIHSFWLETPDEERITRFRAARARGTFDRVTLARFEGELKADAQAARFTRIVGGVLGIGTAFGGVATIAVAATADDVNDDGRTFGIILGSTFIASGLLQVIVNLAVESDHEEALHNYQAPAPDTPKISVAPMLGARALGLSAKATF